MTSDQILAEIREANLSYLMLAQSLIRTDRDQALFRLGLSEDSAGMIAAIAKWFVRLIALVVAFDALGLGQLGQAVRVVDLARGLPRSLGLGSASQVLQGLSRKATPRVAYLYLGDLGVDLALPDEHSVHDKAEFAEHALIDRKPRLQSTGAALTERKLVPCVLVAHQLPVVRHVGP